MHLQFDATAQLYPFLLLLIRGDGLANEQLVPQRLRLLPGVLGILEG